MILGIIEPDSFSPEAIANLAKYATVELYDGKTSLEQFISNKTVIFIRLKYYFSQQILQSAPELQYVCSPTTGLNHIDCNYCETRKIKVVSLKGEIEFLNTIRATPEHTLGLILALKRNYHTAFLNTENNVWNRDFYRGYEIFGSKIGIIGLGRVGQILANYLINMGAEVFYFDVVEKETSSSLKKANSTIELINMTDTVVLCSSYNEQVGSIINEQEIDALQGKYFVNTARAELTNEKLLLERSSLGLFKGIAIDVIQHEQTDKRALEDWLKAGKQHNVIITPHIGGATYTSMERTEEFIAGKFINYIA